MDSWTIFKPRASRSRSRLRRQVSYDSVTENQCDGSCDLKKVIKVSKKQTSLLGYPTRKYALSKRSRLSKVLGLYEVPKILVIFESMRFS